MLAPTEEAGTGWHLTRLTDLLADMAKGARRRPFYCRPRSQRSRDVPAGQCCFYRAAVTSFDSSVQSISDVVSISISTAPTPRGTTVSGYIEPSGTGMSIRYQLEIEGPAEYMILGYPGDDGLIAQSTELRGERLRTGYLSMGDPDPDLSMWRRPRGLKLVVYFEGDAQLSARLTLEPTRCG